MQPIPELLAMATVNIFSLDNRSNTATDSNSRGCQHHCELFLRWWSWRLTTFADAAKLLTKRQRLM